MARTVFSALVVVATLAVVGVAGCDKASHDNIDKWMSTKKGFTKLKETLTSASVDPDLAAHAASNLLRRSEDEAVRAAFEAMPPPRREQVVAKLAPRLWTMARVDGEMARPTPAQETAKDTLFDLRPWADAATRAVIDGYLTDWLAGGYYEGRAIAGRHQGAQIIRVLGPKAGERLIAEANRLIATPDQDGRRRRIGDQLLLGLAASGSPDAVVMLLDIFAMDRGDDTLAERAIAALYRAYLDPKGLFDFADPAALVGSVSRLSAIAMDDRQSAQTANDAVQLIRAAGQPHCVEPLLAMIGHPHRDPRFRWVGINNALRCGGPDVLPRVIAILPTGASYDAESLGGSTWKAMPGMGNRERWLEVARELVGSRSWVGRWIAIETIGVLESKADASLVAGLAADRAKLVGYWGDQTGSAGSERKAEPTLGQRAKEIAVSLK